MINLGHCGRCGARVERVRVETYGCDLDVCPPCRMTPESCTCRGGNVLTLSENAAAPTLRSDGSDGSDTPEAWARSLLDSVRVRDGAWLSEQTFPPLRYAVPGLIPEGLTIAIGPPKVGKSWFFGNILLGVASGGSVLGKLHIPNAREVLNLALEDGDRRMQSRCQLILGGADRAIPEAYNYVTTIPPGQVIAVVEAFLLLHPNTALVVLDTLGKVMPDANPGESAYARDYRIGGRLKRIADEHPGLALVVIHHDRKATSDDFVEAVSGTNGLAGSADTVMVLCRRRGAHEGLLKVTGRDVPEAEYALKFDGMVWTLDGTNLLEATRNARRREESANLSETSTDIIDFIRERPNGTSAKQVRDKFGVNADQYLKRLYEGGKLTKIKRGLYAVSDPSEPSELQVADSAESDGVSFDDEGLSA